MRKDSKQFISEKNVVCNKIETLFCLPLSPYHICSKQNCTHTFRRTLISFFFVNAPLFSSAIVINSTTSSVAIKLKNHTIIRHHWLHPLFDPSGIKKQRALGILVYVDVFKVFLFKKIKDGFHFPPDNFRTKIGQVYYQRDQIHKIKIFSFKRLWIKVV